MAKYRITDPQSGRTVTVSGDSAPTQQEAEQIFTDAGLRNEATNQSQSDGGIVGKLADFFIGRSIDYINEEGRRRQDIVKNKGVLSPENLLEISPLGLFLNPKEGGVEIDRKGVAAAGEVASYLVPGSKLLKGTSGAKRIVGAGVQGATMGGIMGATDAENKNLSDVAQNAMSGALTGSVAGGLFQGAGEVMGKVITSAIKQKPEAIKKIIRPNPKVADQFRRNTKWDFAEEIIKRDGKEIMGMDYPQLIDYFTNKFSKASSRVDKMLESTGKTLNKDWLKKQFVDVTEKYKDRPLVSQKVNETFATYVEYLDRLPDEIPVQVANQIKRDLQEAASAAYGNTSNSVPKAYSRVASRLRKEINRLVPESKTMDKETQLYKLVKDGVERTYSREENKISKSTVDKVLQSLPFAAGAGVGAITQDPLQALLTVLATAGASRGREAFRSPQVQTRIAPGMIQGGNEQLNSMRRLLEETLRKGVTVGSTR